MFNLTADLYDAIYAARSKDYAAESQQLHETIQKNKKATGNSLLDVGCGTGVHLTYLVEHYQPVGLDLDETLLDIARERLPGVRFYPGDMAAFDLGEQFDAVICLFSSIGYVKTVDRLNKTLLNFGRHTRPGGVAIVEPWYSAEKFRDGDMTRPRASFVDEPELKVARMSESGVDGRISTLKLHYLMSTRDGVRYLTETHEMGLFTHEEYMTAFNQAGFNVTHDPEGIAGRGLYIGLKT